MNLQDFDYPLPEELIAQRPLLERDRARLMVVNRKKQTIDHDVFKNVGTYLPAGSPLVLNNSKVIPARLLGEKQRTGGKVEIFLLKKLLSPKGTYSVLLRPTKKIKTGDTILFKGSSLQAKIVDVEKRIVSFNRDNVLLELSRVGHMPLPPYIKRADRKEDREFYQTVYARYPGSVAAPTAGLHFTSKLLKDLKTQGHEISTVTLHINYGTFKPVEEEDITQHQMHKEQYSLSNALYMNLKEAKRKKKEIVTVGTTSCRVLESVAQYGKCRGITNLFIYPGYSFKMVDALITNFHLPRSSLLMLVYALGGMSLMKQAYQEAVRERYRFYSYGDAMIIV